MLGFRVWDSEKKEFIEEDEDHDMWLGPDGRLGRTSLNGRPSTPFKKFIPMQSTGLLDCKGKEIFESDIIRFHDEKEAIIEDVRDFLICLHPSDSGKEKYHLNCEIVGNKFENPEILENE